MALTPGTRLGPYDIIAPLGAGGMGEVYRATDTNLAREVAIKVLLDAVASDAERLARFDREARTLASLNHPNIAAIYGLERSGATTALVMELVEGPTLADRIAQGAIPVDEALAISRQIAEALEAAHEQGIIHRDLKPANIKVRGDGTVKVLDFGLAKAIEPAAGSSAVASQSPTITTPAMTQAGVVLGTAAYMAPEQAKGRPAGRRSDVWSFGCVLYEMLTGRRAFDGDDMVDVLGAVARLEPTWAALPSDLPQSVHTLLRGCLAKDPRKRTTGMAAALFVLEHQTGPAGSGAVVAGPLRRTSLWRRALPVAVAMIVGMLMTALAVMYTRSEPVELAETRLEISTPPGRLSFFKLSPDGRNVLFSATAAEGEPPQLWLRPLASESTQALAGTENAGNPFWSPDGRSIGFIAGGKLMRLDLSGGGARSMADANGQGGTWGPDGTILFTPTATSALYRVPASGGSPVEATRLDTPAEASHRFPAFLPDGRHFLFFVAGTADVQGIYVGELDTKETRRLLASNSAAVFALPDYVLFARDGNLLAQRLDLDTLEIAGDSFSVGAQVSGDQGTSGEIALSTSASGVIAYRAPMSNPAQLTWFDRAGRETGTVGAVGPPWDNMRISPDGRSVAASRIAKGEGERDVWLIEAARGVLRRFTFDPASDGDPIWSPNGDRVVFQSRRGGPNNLWLKRVDGGTEERLRESTDNEVPADWSPDGRFLLFTRQTSAQDLWALPVDTPAEPLPVATTRFQEVNGRFAPDGRSVAYQSNETGRSEIYIVPFPGPGVPAQVSTDGGTRPQWRDTGREIVYLSPDNQLMAVSVRPTPNGTPEIGVPSPLFQIPLGAVYDISRDGQRILINKPVGRPTTPPITLIQHWKPRT